MKKLTALLFACMMMTCTFTACGSTDDDDDDDNKKSTSSSASATDEDDDDDDDETEPTTKKKKPTTTEAEEDTSEDATEPTTKKKKPTTTEAEEDTSEDATEPTTKKKKPTTTEAEENTSEDNGGNNTSGKVDSKIVGKWNTKESGYNGSYVFDASGKGSVYLDATSMYHFEGDTLMIGSEKFGPDAYDFDGKNFKLEANGVEFFNMKKTEGEKNSLDGTYNIVGGYFYDVFEEQYANTTTYSLDMIVDGKELFFRMNDCFTFTADGKTMKFIEGAELMNNEEISYTIVGNKMTFTAGGAKQVLTKD